MEKGRKQGVLGRNKEKQNNNKNTFHLPRQKPYFYLKMPENQGIVGLRK